LWTLLIKTTRRVLEQNKLIDEMRDSEERLQVEFVSRESEMEELRADMCDEIEKIKKEESEPVCSWVGCWEVRYGGWRFCKDHLKRARKELTEDGYLQSIPWQGGPMRTVAMMENTRETKYGKDQ
jgi:hypothetical protein